MIVATSSDANGKLSQRVAGEIANEIDSAGIEAGCSLGREAELTVKWKVSRWTLREAITILEQEGRVEIRRGRQGGVYVATPSLDGIATSISSYLEFLRMNVSEIVEARRVLDEAIIKLAIQRLKPSDAWVLRDVGSVESEDQGVEAGFVQYRALLKAARSPILEAFVLAVGHLGISAILRSNLADSELEACTRLVRTRRRDQVEAVIAGQLAEALTHENVVLEANARLLDSAPPGIAHQTEETRARALRFLKNSRRFGRPELLMHEIAADIVAQGWSIGSHLGSEPSLLSRYSVSRTVFREAVRSLEQIGVVEMKSGRNSGLKIGQPNPRTVVDSALRQFGRMELGASAIMDALSTVGTAIVGLAATRRSADFVETTISEVETLFDAIGEASNNRILALMFQIVMAIDKMSPTCPLHGIGVSQLQSLQNAVDAGDAPFSRRIFLDSLITIE